LQHFRVINNDRFHCIDNIFPDIADESNLTRSSQLLSQLFLGGAIFQTLNFTGMGGPTGVLEGYDT
jgi:hypothetical protein